MFRSLPSATTTNTRRLCDRVTMISPSIAEICSSGCCTKTIVPGGGYSVQFWPVGIFETYGNVSGKHDASVHDFGTKTPVLTGATIPQGLRVTPCKGAKN